MKNTFSDNSPKAMGVFPVRSEFLLISRFFYADAENM
jgi:hypothetical protein